MFVFVEQEFRQQEVNEARVVDHETIARLKIQLEETEGLLSRKMAELQATIEAKVAACEAASEWESKYMSLNLKLKEFEKGDRTPILLRRSLETSSFAGSRNDRQWFRLRSRISAESIKSTENNVSIKILLFYLNFLSRANRLPMHWTW